MGRLCAPISILKHGVLHTFVEDGDGVSRNFVRDHFRDWEPETFRVFDDLRDRNRIAIDLGAWIGTTCIWLSHHFRSVVAVEPDPQSNLALARNLEASACQNVVVIPRPVSRIRSKVVFGSHSHGGHLNDSTSQIKLQSSSSDDILVDTVTFADVVAVFNPDDVGLIKVDIEGGEEDILEDLIAFIHDHPTCSAYVSFHVPWWRNSDLSRFDSLLATVRASHPNGGPQTSAVDFLRIHPFGSLLLGGQ